jgi:hypothetical protein
MIGNVSFGFEDKIFSSVSRLVSGSASDSSGRLRKRIASLVKRFILIRAAKRNTNRRKMKIPMGINNVNNDSKLFKKQLKKVNKNDSKILRFYLHFIRDVLIS